MADPKRRERRNPHLDAGVLPVENALLARADALETTTNTTTAYGGSGWSGNTVGAGGGGTAAYGDSVTAAYGDSVTAAYGDSVTAAYGDSVTACAGGGGGGGSSSFGSVNHELAAEFRNLAEELHWW